MLVLTFFVENDLNNMYERLDVFDIVVHCTCVSLVCVGILKRVEIQSIMY